MDKEILKKKTESPASVELTKPKRNAVKNLLNKMKSNARMADLLTYVDMVLGEWDLSSDQVEEIKAITEEDVKREANTFLIRKYRTVDEIIPEKSMQVKNP